MASGKPIIACLNGEGGEVVKEAKCGWSVKAGDAEGLAKLVTELSMTNKSTLKEKGFAGKAYYETHFDKETCLEYMDKIMGLT